MVALLWGKGQHGVTLRLEELWNNLCRAEQFSLLCAYPAAAFAGTSAISRGDIDAAHKRCVQAA
jgi:hypothetical protein